ncbi:carboxymuconolactone decarboxylase family protein [Cochlodiniinecator piscidefendens]|uniref:carboxymuconolactone decarboxylase family protein n=1 Tax=Cochlodiniinecator piscidefendens TaxID=2715756 RepID=UPI00140C82A3|nr:carboxymuconolactone decarboxylase family protein [Cochlodiniinecator piscidefendens]
MTDFSKLFQTMMEQGQDMARTFAPELEKFQPKGFEDLMPTMSKNFLDMAFGNTFNREGLDSKTRLLVIIAGLTVTGSVVESQMKLSIKHALEAGATKREIAEVIHQMTMFGGLPAATKALDIAEGVFEDHEEKSE